MTFTLEQLVTIITAHTAALQAKREATDDHPIANAMDRAHAIGGQTALVNFQNVLLEMATNVLAAEGAERERARA